MMPHGHSTDEAALRDRNHPGHRSGSREGMWAALIVMIVGLILFSSVELPWMPQFAKIMLTLIVATGVAVGVSLTFSRAESRSRARLQEEYRADLEAETQRKIAAMKAAEAEKQEGKA